LKSSVKGEVNFKCLGGVNYVSLDQIEHPYQVSSSTVNIVMGL